MATDVFADVGVAKSHEAGDAVAWGLASLGLGAVTLLAAPITLIFNVLLWQSGATGGIPKVPAILAATVGLLIMLGLAGCGTVFGLRGRQLDEDLQKPSPLASAGVLVSVAAMILWMIAGIDLLAILVPF
jgi:hypothetical protein